MHYLVLILVSQPHQDFFQSKTIDLMLTTSTATRQERCAAIPAISEQRANWYQYLSLKVWGMLPSAVQRNISKVYSNVYNQAFSKHFIKPYCKLHYADPNYIDQFKPPHGKGNFETFQDFFIRYFKELPPLKSDVVWPCEGLLCHFNRVNEVPVTNVKGDIRRVEDIFGVDENTIPKDYQFANVFLHNKNYHRIHSPINGEIVRIQHIEGDLVVLRPWIYRENPSIPAFRNERVNIDIKDEQGRIWYLSIVGGPAVGTIDLPAGIELGAKVETRQELAVFYLGSTCCMASPEKGRGYKNNQLVWMGEPY